MVRLNSSLVQNDLVTPQFANVGVPMIFPQMVIMMIALAPIVVVEAVITQRQLRVSFKSAAKTMGIANLASTAIGIPMAWCVMLGLNLSTTGGVALGLQTPLRKLVAVTLQAAWLIPYENHLFWMIPCAATFLLIPSFIASVLLESLVAKLLWNDIDRKLIKSAVLRANLWSYLILFLGGCLWTFMAIY